MRVFESRTAHELYRKQLVEVLQGPLVKVRGLVTHELLDVATVITEPWQHAHYVPGRRWNPWLAMSEAIWILAGRQDIFPLLPYNKRIAQFSDDGNTLWGAYGKRIKRQIEPLLQRLREDPSDRRALLSIWREEDLQVNSFDPPCLAGDTVVFSPEGDVPIRQLVGRRYPIYSLGEDKKIALAWAQGVSRGRKPTLSVKFDSGEPVVCTPEHQFFVKRRKRLGHEKKQGSTMLYAWKRAEELAAGDGIVAIHLERDEEGYRTLRNFDVTENWSGANKRSEHRLYYEFLHGPIKAAHDVHHRNHYGGDNRASNLLEIGHGEHAQHHKADPDGKRYGELKKNTRKTGWTEEALLDFGQRLFAKQGFLSWGSFNTEYKGIVSGSIPQNRWGKWSNYVSAVVGNHKVVSVKPGPEQEVYDLEVEGNHNFFVAPGVLVHNCNDLLMFKLRDQRLHMTVINRSNDLHWGLYAVNLPTFGILQDYLAAALGVEMGNQTHLSNSLHVYLPDGKMEQNWAITLRMRGEASRQPLPELIPCERAFSEPIPYELLRTECSLVLSEEHEYKGDIPFLQFADDFLRAYREQGDIESCRNACCWPDWIQAAQVHRHGDLMPQRVWES